MLPLSHQYKMWLRTVDKIPIYSQIVSKILTTVLVILHKISINSKSHLLNISLIRLIGLVHYIWPAYTSSLMKALALIYSTKVWFRKQLRRKAMMTMVLETGQRVSTSKVVRINKLPHWMSEKTLWALNKQRMNSNLMIKVLVRTLK
jgi:uncharacterized membrane protein YGL010W